MASMHNIRQNHAVIFENQAIAGLLSARYIIDNKRFQELPAKI